MDVNPPQKNTTRSRWKLFAVVVVSCLIACIVAVYHHVNRRPSLTIPRDGKPMASVTVNDLQTFANRSTNSSGTIYLDGPLDRQQGVFLSEPDGSSRMLMFPEQGDLVVDLRGRYSISTTMHYDLGFIKSTSQSEQFSTTQQEVEQLRRGEITMEQLEQKIRDENR